MTLRRQQSLFTMSAFSGLLAIRRYLAGHPGILTHEIVTALKRASPDDAYHDYETALVLHGWIREGRSLDNIPAFFREILSVLVQQVNPWWLRLSPFGRDHVKAALSPNEMQCFEAAGLFSQVPTGDILQWWDTLAQGARATHDSKLLEQGRAAELLTIDYETQRLSALGIPNRPRWISLDDNAAGYDVHSFEKGPVEPVAKLIEVKSCANLAQEIFLTRNEWETAIERAPSYRFHIWILPEKKLIELEPSDLQGHVPQDQGDGLWQTVRIGLSKSVL